MSEVVAISPEAEKAAHEHAWSQLSHSLQVLKDESAKPKFRMSGFTDAEGRTWSVPALIREVESRINYIKLAAR